MLASRRFSPVMYRGYGYVGMVYTISDRFFFWRDFDKKKTVLYVMKPIEERLEECVAMRMWLRSVQIDEEPEIQHLRDLMNRFTKYAETASGTIHVNKIQKRVAYMLSMRAESKIGFLKK